MDLIHSLGTWGFWLASYLVPFVFVLARHPYFFIEGSATSWSHDGAGFRLQRSLLALVRSCSA